MDTQKDINELKQAIVMITVILTKMTLDIDQLKQKELQLVTNTSKVIH